MNLFGKIYSIVLILFILVISFITFKSSTGRIVETKKLLIEKHRITGSLVTSEIQRWQSEGKWPFKALSALTEQDDFLFWWIIAADNSIYLADNADYAGTDSSTYFPGFKDLPQSQDETGNVALNMKKNFGIYSQFFTVGNERWTFWLGFSTRALREAKDQIIFSTLLYTGIALLFLGGVLFWIIRAFLQPLKDLTKGVFKIGAGDLHHRLYPTSRDEIGRVAQAFNQMADSLQNDITKREKVEEELSFTQFAVESSADAAFWITPNAEFSYVNKAATRRLGFSKEELLEMSVADVDPDFPKDIWPNFWQKLKNHKSLQFETIHRTKDGIIFPVEVVLNYMEFRGEECSFAFVRDISERKEAEQALAAEKERLAVTLRSIGDGVITADTSGRVVLLNKVAEKLTGWSSLEASGRPIEEVFHIINERTREVCENPVTKVLGSGQIINLTSDTTLIAKDGTQRNIADSGAPILDADSKIVGVVLVFRDVTDQLKTEKELLKVKKLESVGVLAGGIAHDFNNILAAILGNINLAALDSSILPETKELLDEAEKASLRAKKLTQQLLTFSKGGEPVKKTASLESVIRDSANFILHGDKVACSYTIPEDLWLVDIDKGQMSQVIQNIVINASHAMPTGGIILISCENIDHVQTKEINLPRDKKFVRVVITDSGIGIPENVVGRIFDPYFSTKQEGSGLGLAISHSIIMKHNGHITVKSTPGTGTAFTIYLPASAREHTENKREEGIDEDIVKVKIMVMDDEEMVRNVAQAMLSRLGHKVMLAQDGDEAIKLYKGESSSGDPIDIVIMDLTIPGGMGGKDAVKEILAYNPEAKVIVSSGYSNDPIMANYQKYGFCASIVKPYQIQELTQVINLVAQ